MDSITTRYPVGLSREILDSYTLDELLRIRARDEADTLAYRFLPDEDSGEVNLTYAELDRQARAVAASLQAMGASGGRALLLYPPGLEFVAAFFGCLYAGVVAVPAYPARNERGVSRLRAIVKDAQARVVLTTSPILAMSNRLFAQASDLAGLSWLATDGIADEIAGSWQLLPTRNSDLAFLQYTSGSTGRPKGVMLTHGNLLHNASVVYNAVEHNADDRYVSWLPTFHDMGFMAGVLEPLYAGIPAILLSPVSFLARPFRWLQAISHYKGTTSGGPNFAYDLCARKITEDQISTLDLSSWTVAFNGAEPIRAETLDRFAKTFERCGLRREVIYPCYGLAEATLIVSGGKKSAPPVVRAVQYRSLQETRVAEAGAGDEDTKLMVGCGSALGGQRVAIVNPETLIECSPAEIGEIWVSGPSVAQGYWNNPEETERTFYARIADTGEGPFLRTGDLGYLQGGELFVAGRIKDLIIIRGTNHYPQDIELTVERSQPGFKPGCNAAFSIDVAGEERLVVVQEVDVRKQPDVNAALDAVRQVVAEEHELQVHAISLIPPGTIPKTSSGKIQRHATREAFLKGRLNVLAEWRGAQPSQAEIEAPLFSGKPESVEEVQEWLASQVASKLGVGRSAIDASQPVAQYGIDSLIDIELIHSIQSNLGVSLPVLTFLQSASISEIASVIVDRLKTPSAAGEPLVAAKEPQRESPLSYGQQALWFLHQFAPNSSAYNIARAVRVPREVNVAALRRAFQALVDRHPSLRTTFKASDEMPVQLVHDRLEVSFNQEDASAWGDEALNARLLEEAGKPFDLENGPVFKVSMFTRSDREGVLLISVHHIVADLWSMAVLLKELSVLYGAEESGTGADLPAPALTYADYVKWQTQTLEGARGEELWAYWREQLSGKLPVLDLPTDHPRPPVQTYASSSESLKLSPELTEKLKALGRDRGATLYMILLAAYQVLLYRHTGQEEVLIGSPTTGRGHAQLEGLAGYFVNPIVIRTSLSGSQTFQSLLAQVRQTVLGAFEHQDYPFLLLADRLQPDRDPSRSPLFQTMFVLQKAPLFADHHMAALAIGEAGAQIKLGSLVLESMKLEQQEGQFDLTLMVAETGSGLTASFQYNSDIFEAETIRDMASHFANLLEAIASAPEEKVARVRMMTEAELRRILVDWNDTAADFPRHLCLHDLFERQA
ncbi:MAG: condensation domain-containing protein, partial [Blastocatellia bacterium]